MPRQASNTALHITQDKITQPSTSVTRVTRSSTNVSKRKADSDFKLPAKRSALGDVTNRNSSTTSTGSKSTAHSKHPVKVTKKACTGSKIPPVPARALPKRTAVSTSSSVSSFESFDSSRGSRSRVYSETSDSGLSSVEGELSAITKKSSKAAVTSSRKGSTSSASTDGTSFVSISSVSNKSISSTKEESEPKSEVKPAVEAPQKVKDAQESEVKPEPAQAAPQQAAAVEQTVAVEEEQPKYDYDESNNRDIFQAPEYARDIFEYYTTLEKEYTMPSNWLQDHPHITEKMRMTLVDWLIEVQEQFQLNHETLYLAIKLTDLYVLRHHELRKEKLQLVGATAMFLAAKFDERIAAPLDDFIYICGNEDEERAYSRREFINMEKSIFKTVGFNLGIPISYRFLRRFAKTCLRNMQTLTLARYMNETLLLYSQYNRHTESLVAAGCLRLAMLWLEPKEQWGARYEHYTSYTNADLRAICLEITDTMISHRTSQLQTAAEKYAHEVFHCVSDMTPLPRATVMNNLSSS